MRSKELHPIFILVMTLSMAAGKGIFPEHICDVRCGVNGTFQHSFCVLPRTCADFKHFDMQQTRFKNIKSLLVTAHNGLRNRLAKKFNTHLRYMKWDTELATMAGNFQRLCKTITKDACANFKTKTISMERMADGIPETNYRYIVQNSFYMKTPTAQYNLIEMGVRQWFLEHNQLAAPTTWVSNNNTYMKIIGENNFTHIVSPLTVKFGCASSKYLGGFSLLCYYYPYLRTNESALAYRVRTPETRCPNQYPVQHELFTELCATVELSRATTFLNRRWLLCGDIDVGGCAWLPLALVLLQFGFVGWRRPPG